MNVLVVDDHVMIRKGLMRMLEELDERCVVAQAEDAPSAMRSLRTQPCDVVLLDVALGERDGFDVLRSIRSEFPKLGVVMLSVYSESQFSVRAIRSGAHAFLNKGCSPDELYQAIRCACKGQVYLTATSATLLAQDIRSPSEQAPHERLSNREMQIMMGLCKGLTVSALAQQLSLSANTVSTYRARVLDKLGLKNLVELVNYVSTHQLDTRQ